MDYGLIGKREKAKRYAEDPKRFRFNKFDLTFHGDNNDHRVTFDNGVFEVVVGVVILVWPKQTLVVITWLLAAYLIVLGLVLLFAAKRLSDARKAEAAA